MRGKFKISRITNVTLWLIILLTFSSRLNTVSVLALTVTVSGRVLDEHGHGMSNVEIKVYSSDGYYIKSVSTSSDGSFNIGLTVGGGYILHFSKEGYVKVTKSVYVKMYGTGKILLDDIVLLKALRLSTSILSRVTSPGNKITIPFTVSNLGEEPEIIEFTVLKPKGWSTRILDQIGEIKKAYLSSSDSISLQLEVVIPFHSTGKYNILLTAHGKTNSTLNFTISVQPSSRPLIFCQFPGKSAAPGESVQFQVRLKNPFDVKLRFRVAVGSLPDEWLAYIKDEGGEPVTEIILDSNEFASLIVDVNVPREEKEGEYPILFSASSPAASENLTLIVVVEKITAGIGVDLQATPPYLDAYAGSRAKFRLRLTNGGGYSQLFNLKVTGLPLDLKTWFEGSGKMEITRLYVEAGKQEEFTLVIAIPKGTPIETLNFTVSASSSDVTKTIRLMLNLIGLYKIEVTNENFYLSLPVGGEASYKLKVKNTGTESVTNLDVTATKVPSGFAVDVEPPAISSLKPDEEATFTITVTTQPDINAGNYYLDFEVQSGQTESIKFSLQIGVEQQMNWIYVGGILVLVGIIALFLVYRKFGRR